MSLPLQHPELDDFELTVRRLIYTAHETGGSFLRAEGLSPEDLPSHPKAHRIFIQKCHYGFDLAQRQLGRLVVEYERRIRLLEADLKEFRRARDPRVKAVEELIAVLQNRQLVLRRILDSILYTVLLPDTSIQRRLTSNEEIRGIDPDVTLRTLEVSVERNRSNRFRFNIVADLTTVILYGDLLEIDKKSTRKDRQWRLIELKDGKMNELIGAELWSQGSSSTEEAISALEAAHGKSAAKQARRMVRQQQRLTQLDEIIDTDRGTDPYAGHLIMRSPEMVKLQHYRPAIETAYAQAKANGAGGAVISECIMIVAIQYSAPEHVLQGAAAHTCYHFRNREAPCSLNDARLVQDELQAMEKQPPIVKRISRRPKQNRSSSGKSMRWYSISCSVACDFSHSSTLRSFLSTPNDNWA